MCGQSFNLLIWKMGVLICSLPRNVVMSGISEGHYVLVRLQITLCGRSPTGGRGEEVLCEVGIRLLSDYHLLHLYFLKVSPVSRSSILFATRILRFVFPYLL